MVGRERGEVVREAMIHEAAIRGRGGVGSIGKSNGRDGWYRGIREEEEEEAKEKGKREKRDERQEMIYEEKKKKKTKQRG